MTIPLVITTCPDCEEDMWQLDTITRRSDGTLLCHLYTCHNEDCGGYGAVWNDMTGNLEEGDPSGHY